VALRLAAIRNSGWCLVFEFVQDAAEWALVATGPSLLPLAMETKVHVTGFAVPPVHNVAFRTCCHDVRLPRVASRSGWKPASGGQVWVRRDPVRSPTRPAAGAEHARFYQWDFATTTVGSPIEFRSGVDGGAGQKSGTSSAGGCHGLLVKPCASPPPHRLTSNRWHPWTLPLFCSVPPARGTRPRATKT